MSIKKEIQKKTNIIYFDNGSTTFKIHKMLEEINNYYRNFSFSNNSSFIDEVEVVNRKIINLKNIIAELLNCDKDEIIFTSGTTQGINIVKEIIEKNYNIKKIFLNNAEHSSNLFP